MKPQKLSNKALWVLAYIERNPGSTMHEISENSPISEAKTAERRECSDWARENAITVPSLSYVNVQQAVKKLMSMKLVRREASKDLFGDDVMPWRHFSTEMTRSSDDPLEEIFANPAAEREQER